MVSVKPPTKVTKKRKQNKEPLKDIKIKKGPLKDKKLKKQILTTSEPKVSEVVDVKKAKKFVLPSKYITESIVSSCLSALEKLTPHYNKKNVIFGDEVPIFMEIRSVKIQNTTANIKIVLPHSTIASNGEVCLITPDLKKGKKVDHEPSVDHWEELLRKAGVTSVKTVLPMRQLRVEYDQFELKRRLLTLHDFIMVDNRVLTHVSHLLGKMFFKKHNMLIPVKINEKENLKNDIDVGLRTVVLRLGEGQTSTVLVGHTGMPQESLKENIIDLVNKLKERFPGGEANIRTLSVKLPLSLSLPLYITLRSPNAIDAPKIKRNKPKEFVEYEGELTTKIDRIVRVAPDGTVHLRTNNKKKKNNKKNKTEVEVSDDESDEEMEE